MRLNEERLLLWTVGLISLGGLIISVASPKPQGFDDPMPKPVFQVRSLISESDSRRGEQGAFQRFIQLQEFAGQ